MKEMAIVSLLFFVSVATAATADPWGKPSGAPWGCADRKTVFSTLPAKAYAAVKRIDSHAATIKLASVELCQLRETLSAAVQRSGPNVNKGDLWRNMIVGKLHEKKRKVSEEDVTNFLRATQEDYDFLGTVFAKRREFKEAIAARQGGGTDAPAEFKWICDETTRESRIADLFRGDSEGKFLKDYNTAVESLRKETGIQAQGACVIARTIRLRMHMEGQDRSKVPAPETIKDEVASWGRLAGHPLAGPQLESATKHVGALMSVFRNYFAQVASKPSAPATETIAPLESHQAQ